MHGEASGFDWRHVEWAKSLAGASLDQQPCCLERVITPQGLALVSVSQAGRARRGHRLASVTVTAETADIPFQFGVCPRNHRCYVGTCQDE